MAPQAPFRAPTEAPIVDKQGFATYDWMQHLQISAQQLKTAANQTAPTSSSDPGQNGQLAMDDNFLYVYSGVSNKWKRIALQNF